MPKAALDEQLADLKLLSSQAFVRTSSQSPLNCRLSSPVTNAEVDESLQDDKLWHWQQVKRNHGVIAAFGSRRSKGINPFRPQRKNISTYSELHEKETVSALPFSAWCVRRKRRGDRLEICKMRKPTGNSKPSGDITASSWGRGCKSQIDLNQFWVCR